jgi:ABC-type antimicrobial peptide transport system permease subunit
MAAGGGAFARRVWRNVARRKFRTIGVALVVGASLGVFLILYQIGVSVDNNLNSASSAVKDLLTVTLAGANGFGGFSTTGHITSTTLVGQIQAVSGVSAVQRVFVQTEGIPTGGFHFGGGASRAASPAQGPPGGGGFNSSMFKNIYAIEGIDTTSAIQLFGGFTGGTAPETSCSGCGGRVLDSADEQSNDAMVGINYATNNGTSVGSTIVLNGTHFSVVGIFSDASSSGFSIDNNDVIIPYPTAQVAYNVDGPNLLQVTVNASANPGAVQQAIESAIGSNYDVSIPGNFLGAAGFTSDLNNAIATTNFEAYAALAAGAGVMVVVMALMTSQRTREFGLMKSFGFTNGTIVGQVVSESLVLSVFGLPVGLFVALVVGPQVASQILGNALSSSGSSGPGGGFLNRFLGNNPLTNVTYSLTPEVLLLGVGVALAFAVVGALYPVLRAVRLQPSEALRNE